MTNGVVLDRAGKRLYVTQGAMTNMGAPSARLRGAPEYALSGAILSVDLSRIGDRTYALPTLDDEERAGVEDRNDPFGGNGGRNQAILAQGGPVQLYATGIRNPYDVALTRKGLLYTVDNGPNWYLGGAPSVVHGRCTNHVTEGGRYGPDVLYVVEKGVYYGHPNPTRASRSATFNESKPQSPIDRPRPDECTYTRGNPERTLTTFDTSTNGLAEYTASNFDGALSGDLLTASFDGRIYRIVLDDSGRRVVSRVPLAATGGLPLDVTSQPDEGPFPGTIWTADLYSGDLVVLEPRDRSVGARWEERAPSSFPRQEVSWVRAGNRFYLAGGDRRQEAYDPKTDTWTDVAPLPESLDHIQGVVVDGLIYYIGGLSAYPEPAVGTVLVYDPARDAFSRGAAMPRPRGAGGVAVHDGKIYYAGGLSEGKAVAWFDVYDPKTDSWSELPDMPRARDHFQGQFVGSRFFAIGGRDSAPDANIGDNDAYDISQKRWETGLAPLPTPRGGYASAVVGDEILVLGGEAPDRVFSEVEAYNPRTDTWRALEPMSVPRHGIQAIPCGGDVFVAAGGEEPYAGAPSDVNSVFVSGLAPRCPLVSAEAPKRSTKVGFRRLRIPTGFTAAPTSLQFGPDGRLYVAEQDGTVNALTIRRTDGGSYVIVERERIDLIKDIPNHDDDGSPVASWSTFVRLVGKHLGVCCAVPVTQPPPAATTPAGPGDPAHGRQLFRDAGCVGCHTLATANATGLIGPRLDRAWTLPRAYLEQSIVDPFAVVAPGYPPDRMPSDYGISLSRQQLADLVAFLRERPDSG
jgi:mono/diheme cytochrome c family protein